MTERPSLLSIPRPSRRAGRPWAPLALAVGFGVAGCGGSAISSELANARKTMEEARASAAARYTPDELRVAERTLMQAEQASDGSALEADVAYVADRQARVAMANGNAMETQRSLEQAEQRYRADLEQAAITQQRAVEQSTQALNQTREELSGVRTELEQRGTMLDEQRAELEAREQELAAREAELMQERAGREAAEQRAQETMQRLSELAAIREEQNETIITLNGEVLFATGQSQLLSTAQRRLAAVAEALQAQPERSITIEGHTDARGSDRDNERLSRDRAAAVRDYFVGMGIESDRIEVVGRGEAEPIASNDSPEGRANNRRVEIILAREA